MIPMSLRLDIRDHDRSRVVLWFPLIIIWIAVLVLAIVALPFLLLGALATMRGGPGKRMLLLYPLVCVLISELSGLRIDVDGRGHDSVYVSLD